MKRRTNFMKLSSREAKQAAIEDMKKEQINASILNNQWKVLNQPTLTIRAGLFGF